MSDRPQPPTGLLELVERNARLYAKVSARLDRALRPTGIPKPDRRILQEVSLSEGRTDAELANTLGMSRSQFSVAIARVFEAGLIRSEPSAQHRSQRLITLTELGRGVVRGLGKHIEDVLDRVLRSLEPEEQREIERSTDGLREIPSPKDITTSRLHLSQFCRSVSKVGTEWSDIRVADFFLYAARILKQQMEIFDLGEFAWKISVGDEIAGFCVLSFENRLSRPRVGSHPEIALFFVDPLWRGRGLGRRLLAQCLKKSIEQGMRTVTIALSDDMSDLIRLVKSNGFEPRDYLKSEKTAGQRPRRNYRYKF